MQEELLCKISCCTYKIFAGFNVSKVLLWIKLCFKLGERGEDKDNNCYLMSLHLNNLNINEILSWIQVLLPWSREYPTPVYFTTHIASLQRCPKYIFNFLGQNDYDKRLLIKFVFLYCFVYGLYKSSNPCCGMIYSQP